MKWSERCLNSNLSDQNKAQLSQAISMAMCKTKQAGKRVPQTLHAGFLNYLTLADRRMLSDESQRIFSRCSVAVRRCMAMGLVLPCERSAGHIVATLVDHFGMGQASAQSKHELLLDFKTSRGNSRLAEDLHRWNCSSTLLILEKYNHQ